MGIRIKSELTGVRDFSLTPVLNFEGERPWLEPVPFILLYLLPFLAGHNIKNNIVITKKTCWIQIVAVMGIRIKGELIGVRDLSLTPILNFEGERLQARTGPSLQLLLKNPQVFAVITNRRFCHLLFYVVF